MAVLGNEHPLGITCEDEKMEEKVGGRFFTVNLFILKKKKKQLFSHRAVQCLPPPSPSLRPTTL